MREILDQYNDHLFSNLLPLIEDRPLAAELLKTAEVLDDEAETLPTTAFAWPEERRFAVHTKEATVMSRLYREKCASKVPAHVDQAIAAACDVYGIPEEAFARPKVAAAAQSPDDYLLPSLQKLRVTCADDVKTAESKLLDGFQRLSVEHRAEACGRLIEKAAEYRVQLDPLMHKLAGFTVSSTQALKSWLEARSEASKVAEHRNAFSKLAAAVAKQPAELWDRPTLVKLAGAIHELDQKAGLTKFYDRKLPDPLLSVFNTSKVASAGVELGGKIFPITRLAAFPSAFYGDLLGDDFVREASDGHGGIDAQKLAMILETLPRDQKNLLAHQMGSYR